MYHISCQKHDENNPTKLLIWNLILSLSHPSTYLSAKIFSEGDELIRRYEKGTYWQVIRLNHKMVLVTLRSSGNVDRPELSVNLMPDEYLSCDDVKRAEEMVRYLFNMNLDLKPFYEAIKSDLVMSKITQELWGLGSPSTATVFEALVDSIVEQQISLKVAWTLERRLTETFGDKLPLGDKIYYAFPEPERLANATIEDLRGCGLSFKKSEYIRDLAKLNLVGFDLEKFNDYKDPEKIIEELRQIRGVGVWTAELAMIRGMQKLDALPAEDLGIRRCISHYYCDDRKITGDQVRKIAEAWKGWRGLASFYLIMAEQIGVEV
jgi:DNA-3-methyladenine glycosylase II